MLALDHAAQHIAMHVIGQPCTCETRKNAGIGIARSGACGDGLGNFELRENRYLGHYLSYGKHMIA